MQSQNWNDFLISIKRNASLLIPLSIICVGSPIVFVLYNWEMWTNESIEVPLEIVALIFGLLVQSFRKADRYIDLLYIFLPSFGFSFFLSFGFISEINFNNLFEAWRLTFFIVFVLIMTVTYEEKATPKLTEGLTLLHTLSILYWFMDHSIYSTSSRWILALNLLVLLLSIFSIYHALFDLKHTQKSRLILSIWSSLILCALSVEIFIEILEYPLVQNVEDLDYAILIVCHHFLFGISAIYTFNNVLMLTGFLPGRGQFFNSEYFERVRALSQQHIDRYVPLQVNKADSFFALILISGVYFMNNWFELVPRNFLIWTMVASFPLFLWIKELVLNRKLAS